MMAKIRFVDNFEPDRIGGSKEQCMQLGIKVLSKKSDHSVMWDYECPEIEFDNTKTFDVKIDSWEDDQDYCDVIFKNGVIFGYVCKEDIILVDNKKENKMKKNANKKTVKQLEFDCKKTLISNSDYVDRINSIYDRKNRIYTLLLTAYDRNLDGNNEIIQNIKNDLSAINKEQADFIENYQVLSLQ